MSQKTTKAPISERALFQRINRKLAKEDQKLLRCKESSRGYPELGPYYAVDVNANSVAAKWVDLEEWGRDLKVLADWETLAAT